MQQTKNITIGAIKYEITKTEEKSRVHLRRIICQGAERILGAEVSGTRRIWSGCDETKFANIDGRWHPLSYSEKNHRYEAEETLLLCGDVAVPVGTELSVSDLNVA